MSRRGADFPEEYGQVVDVVVERVRGVGIDALVGPRVTLAIGYGTVGPPHHWQLLSPDAKVRGPTVDEEHRLAFALLAVGKGRPIHLGHLDVLERRARHRVGLPFVARLANSIGLPNGSAFSGQQQRGPDPILRQEYAASQQPRSTEQAVGGPSATALIAEPWYKWMADRQ